MHHSFCIIICYRAVRSAILATAGLLVSCCATTNITAGILRSVLYCLLKAISITQTGTPEEKLDLAFRLYDIDRNGVIEEHEMVEIIRVIQRQVSDIH